MQSPHRIAQVLPTKAPVRAFRMVWTNFALSGDLATTAMSAAPRNLIYMSDG